MPAKYSFDLSQADLKQIREAQVPSGSVLTVLEDLQRFVANSLYSQAVDIFEAGKEARFGVDDPSLQAIDKRYAAKCDEALEDALTPLARWVTHDWIGKVLGLVDATSDEAMAQLLTTASHTAANEYFEDLLKANGSEAAILGLYKIVFSDAKGIPPMAKNEYVVFFDTVTEAAVDMMGEDWTTAKVLAVQTKPADTAAATELLKCAGYVGLEAEVQSFVHGANEAKAFAQRIKNGSDASQQPQLSADPGRVEPTTSDAPGALAVIRAKTSMDDKQIGELLGVSRSSIGNIVEGKAKKPMTTEGKMSLSSKVREVIAELTSACVALES